MDGLGAKFSIRLDEWFERRPSGAIVPKAPQVIKGVENLVKGGLTSSDALAERLYNITKRVDVVFANRPYGTTPVIGAGFKLFGTPPKMGDAITGFATYLPSKGLLRDVENRQRRIKKFQSELLSLTNELKPQGDQEELLLKIEKDQAMTGGGFDGVKIGDITKSGLDFLTHALFNEAESVDSLEAVVVEGCLALKEELIEKGLRKGSLAPQGASLVRFEQNKDGLIAFPTYAVANAELTTDLADRLLKCYGVDTRVHVGTTVIDKHSGISYKYRVVDALAYVIDHTVLGPTELCSVLTLLARIQKHGWKEDAQGSYGFIEKPGKARSIYPNSSIPTMIEAMTMAPFIKALKELKIDLFPSLQDKPTRVDMIWKILESLSTKGYDMLAADESGFDKRVVGWILATIIDLVIRPFFNVKYNSWIDASIFILTYKSILIHKEAVNSNEDSRNLLARITSEKRECVADVGDYYLIFTNDGLMSAAKITHVGGSLYGLIVFHYCVPVLLGFKPIFGIQAGDDTCMPVPLEHINASSVELTYKPISDAMKRFAQDLNVSKQIWHQHGGEIAKVFLQETYHKGLDIRGVGSIARPVSAIFYAEDLSSQLRELVQLQILAEVSRLNQGSDNPFVKPYVKFVVDRDKYLAYVYKSYGESAFGFLIESTGMSAEQIANEIGIGSFTWSVGTQDLRSKSLPINGVLAEVASDTVVSESAAGFVNELKQLANKRTAEASREEDWLEEYSD